MPPVPPWLGRALSPRFWPWRLAIAVLAPRLPIIVIDRAVRLPGGEFQRLIETRLLSALVSLLVLVAVVRLLEGRTLAQTGLFSRAAWGRRVAEGLALGASPVLAYGAGLAGAGLAAFSWPGEATLAEAAGLAAVILVAAVDEEIRFRGLAFRILEEGTGSSVALIVSGALFGAAHAGNRGATPLGVVVVAIGGVLLAACYLLHRSLWIPIGFHFAWNTTMGAVLGLPISGIPIPALLRADVTGPGLWTGGRFGPEASLPMAIFVVLASATYVWRAAAAGRFARGTWLRELRGPVSPGPACPGSGR
ncbi:CPBP family intramembrane glutamic endopeptidase [Anaeromyxobacter oryzae]|uniref:CAAX prenyl protease 2/Lysostaphin resistance protein A-like domain-containing protein n=1 Tax=Anaeromyxobacter oryzae TaxID=2918170 RepID=A0ABM7WZ83_9BACT|nr:CPBP family intramembrane glutamic endopeptidase [Anaeromyxobacter oryzae]BDG04782.1 hypothetical protein AMOR_37780 [Anaeromyxobacter oryzae]